MVIHARGEARTFELRSNPLETVAGHRFALEHEGAMLAAQSIGPEGLPPGVLGELMRVLYEGPHEAIDWEYDAPRWVVRAMLVRAAVGMGGALPGEADEIETEADETAETVTAATLEG